MFKIPKWEDDVPKSSIAFGKAVKNKKEKIKDTNVSSEKPSKISKNAVSPVKESKRKKLKKKKLHKTDNNHQHKPVESVIKPKQNTVNIQIGPKVKDKKSRKRKHSNKNSADIKDPEETTTVKKRKFNTNIQKDPLENNESLKHIKSLPNGNSVHVEENNKPPLQNKIDRKKEKFRQLLQTQSNRSQINVSGSNLRQRMLERLKAAQFRFLNEKLYTTSGSEAQKLFQSDPDAFHTYHQGYQQQLKKWPVNPLDLIVKRISKMPKTHMVADMGCGSASLSQRVQQTVRSFDLVASAPGVEACDMARTPLLSASMDVAVYCLALMGTDLTQYLVEANRVLKVGGHLLIAEVESRFDKVESFTDDVQRLGFKLKNLDKSHQVFYFMEFTKVRDPPAKKSKLPTLSLKPCLYKKR